MGSRWYVCKYVKYVVKYVVAIMQSGRHFFIFHKKQVECKRWAEQRQGQEGRNGESRI